MKSISFMLILKNNCFKIKVLREFNSAHKKCENIFFVPNRHTKSLETAWFQGFCFIILRTAQGIKIHILMLKLSANFASVANDFQ